MMDVGMITKKQPKKRQRAKRGLWWLTLLIVILGGYCFWILREPVAAINPTVASFQLSLKTPNPDLAWPSTGQSAVSLNTIDDIQSHGVQKPAPTASVAKIITALCVLKAKPLSAGQQGPTLTLTATDEALYDTYLAQEGSVIPVQAGEQITEYQMLQAVLLPSANNIADSLAIWTFGSLKAYNAYATSYVHSLGLTNTQIGSDASGFAPDTLSTAHDLIVLGKQAMQNPILAQIVGQTTASGIPQVGTIDNVNQLLDMNGIVGIKTGNTDQAGGVFLAAALADVAGQKVIIVTALMGAPTLFQAMRDSLPLIASAQTNFKPVTVLKRGAIVGSYRQPWGSTINAVVSKDVTVTTWNGGTVRASVELSSITASVPNGQQVGTVSTPKTPLTAAQHVPVTLRQAPTQPPVMWRLMHPQIHFKL